MSCNLDFSGLNFYQPCVGAEDCALGECIGSICTFRCEADSDCPGDAETGEALCLATVCAPAACDTPREDGELACIDGVLRRCADFVDPPCEQCGIVCVDGSICVPATDAPCVPLRPLGGECLYDAQCLEGQCIPRAELDAGSQPGAICAWPASMPPADGGASDGG